MVSLQKNCGVLSPRGLRIVAIGPSVARRQLVASRGHEARGKYGLNRQAAKNAKGRGVFVSTADWISCGKRAIRCFLFLKKLLSSYGGAEASVTAEYSFFLGVLGGLAVQPHFPFRPPSLTRSGQPAKLPRFSISGVANMYAIVEEGSKQYKVTSGDTIQIDRPVGVDEKSITFPRVLLVGGDGAAKIGAPLVAGATVTAEVLGEVQAKKVRSVKYKRRKGYRKTIGHRQGYTSVKITAITV
jgi:large subunit ribosomal protein L21